MASAIALIGGDMPFGAEIAARLTRTGARIEPDLAGHGPLDALVVNSPVVPSDLRFDAIDDDRFREALAQQLYAPVAAVQAAAGRLGRGAAIVLVTSRAHLGGWGGAHHMAAGAAIVGMARSMALEFVDADVRVNIVAPGFVGAEWDTPTTRAELAEAVAFLAGPASAGISGETILLDRAAALRMRESARR